MNTCLLLKYISSQLALLISTSGLSCPFSPTLLQRASCNPIQNNDSPKPCLLCLNSSMHSECSADSLRRVGDKTMFPYLSYSVLSASLFLEHSHVCSRLWVCIDSSLCFWGPPISFYTGYLSSLTSQCKCYLLGGPL